MSNLSIGSLLERDFILREVIRSVNIEITTRKRAESREGGWRGAAWSSHYRVIRSSARKTRCYNIRIHTCGEEEGMDRWRLAGIHSGKSIRRSRDREQPAFPWSWDSWISIRPKVIIISGKRNRGTKFFFHTSKNEIQLRGLTYSGVSKRGRLILLASSLGNNTRICSTYVIGNRKCVFFHTFSCLESFKIIEFIALHSSRWVQWRSKIVLSR